MNILMFFVFIVGLMVSLNRLEKYTCVFNNHEFENKGNVSICKKCGLMKRHVGK